MVRAATIYGVICLLVTAATATADDMVFSAGQYGKIDLTIEQSTGNLESVLGDRAKFEPIAGYGLTEPLRQLGSPVGRLDILHRSRKLLTCTASVISSEYVLTNYHCVPGSGEHGPVREASLVMGYVSQTNSSGVKRYQIDPTPVEQSEELDYAILQVENDPSARWGTVRLLNEDPDKSAAIWVYHHPLGAPQHVTRGNCRTAPDHDVVKEDKILHSCDTLPGSSGAPLFVGLGRGVIGLHFAGFSTPGPGQYNSAKRITQIAADSEIIAGIIDGYPTTQPKPITTSRPYSNSAASCEAAGPDWVATKDDQVSAGYVDSQDLEDLCSYLLDEFIEARQFKCAVELIRELNFVDSTDRIVLAYLMSVLPKDEQAAFFRYEIQKFNFTNSAERAMDPRRPKNDIAANAARCVAFKQ